MKYTYEGHPDFSVFPSMIGAYDIGRFRDVEHIPGIPLPHRSKLLHGESATQFHKPIKVGDTFKSNMKVVDVIDKKSGALLCVKHEYIGSDGEVYAT